MKALEESANGPKWKPMAPVKPPLTDRDAILELWAKRDRLPLNYADNASYKKWRKSE